MLGDELYALVVTVARSAFEQFDARAVTVGFGKGGNDSQRRQARQRFNIIGGFNGVVHVFAEQRQTNAANQADQEGQRDIASFGGSRRIRGDHGRIDDANIGGAQPGGNARFFQFGKQAVVKSLISF